MSQSKDLNHQDFGVVQSDKQPLPVTMAAALTITPTTRLTFLSGATQVANIVPPTTGYCSVVLCFTTAQPGAMLTNGALYPIKTAYQPITERPITLHWDPSSKYWWVEAVA